MLKTANSKRGLGRLVREEAGNYGASSSKGYDLEERTFRFAQDVRQFVKALPKTIANIEDAKQLVRASGSVGANYIEANEALGQKDFVMKIKICRKEAKESRFFLRLLDLGGKDGVDRDRLAQEATELMNIFGAIFRKSQS
jgi:four helix bundle protein